MFARVYLRALKMSAENAGDRGPDVYPVCSWLGRQYDPRHGTVCAGVHERNIESFLSERIDHRQLPVCFGGETIEGNHRVEQLGALILLE